MKCFRILLPRHLLIKISFSLSYEPCIFSTHIHCWEDLDNIFSGACIENWIFIVTGFVDDGTGITTSMSKSNKILKRIWSLCMLIDCPGSIEHFLSCAPLYRISLFCMIIAVYFQGTLLVLFILLWLTITVI